MLVSVHFSSQTSEWTTPPHIIEGVVRALGHIDLDPCAEALNPGQSFNVPARKHYTRYTNGLHGVRWSGTVFMNPPYGREIGDWTEKFAREYAYLHMTEGIALVPARTDTRWWHDLTSHCAACCFIKGRLKFGKASNSAPFPSALLYAGVNLPPFIKAFDSLGAVWEI